PAGAAVELRAAGIEIVAAAGAHERAGALFVVERGAERALGILLAQNAILGRRQAPLPFGIGIGDLIGLGLGRTAAGGEHGNRDPGSQPGKGVAARLNTVGHGAYPAIKLWNLC